MLIANASGLRSKSPSIHGWSAGFSYRAARQAGPRDGRDRLSESSADLPKRPDFSGRPRPKTGLAGDKSVGFCRRTDYPGVSRRRRHLRVTCIAAWRRRRHSRRINAEQSSLEDDRDLSINRGSVPPCWRASCWHSGDAGSGRAPHCEEHTRGGPVAESVDMFDAMKIQRHRRQADPQGRTRVARVHQEQYG